MKHYKITAMSLAAFLLVLSPKSFANCIANAFSTLPKEINWRQDTTYALNSKGDIAETSKSREKKIETESKDMEDSILNWDSTPLIEFFAAEKVKAKTTYVPDDNEYEPTRISIGNLGASGILRGTLLLPVSGHTGAANARKWATTDTYTIKTDISLDAAGKKWKNGNNYYENGSEPTLIKKAKSLGVVTKHEVELQLVKGKAVRIIYFRSGSGGPAGFFEGRVIELFWDGT